MGYNRCYPDGRGRHHAFCCATVIAVAIAGAASAGGVLWGGGTAILNYGSSFKENMIDSNRTAA